MVLVPTNLVALIAVDAAVDVAAVVGNTCVALHSDQEYYLEDFPRVFCLGRLRLYHDSDSSYKMIKFRS